MILVLAFFITNGSVPHIHYFKSMFPFFHYGYGLRRIQFFDKLRPHTVTAMVASGLLYLVILLVYRGKWSFYYFGMTSFPQLTYYYLLMIVVGFAGIVFFYYVTEFFFTHSNERPVIVGKMVSVAAKMGGFTLAIYLMQGILMSVLECFEEKLRLSTNWINYGVSLISAAAFMVLAYYIIGILQRNKWLSCYF